MILLRTIIVLVSAISACCAAAGRPADGMVHHWNFDGTKDWHDSPFGMVPDRPERIQDLAGTLDLVALASAGLCRAANWQRRPEIIGSDGGAQARSVGARDVGPGGAHV